MSTATSGKRMSSTAVRRRVRTRILGTAGASLSAVAVWAVAVLLDVDLVVGRADGSETVGPGSVVLSSLCASVLGWGLLTLLERHTQRARTIWTAVALVALLLSFGGPLSGGLTTATKVILSAMHLTVATVLITVFGRSSPVPLGSDRGTAPTHHASKALRRG